MPHADLNTYELNHRKRLTRAHSEYAQIVDKLDGILSDIRRRSDLDPASAKRLESAARQAARDQLRELGRQHSELVAEGKKLLRRARRDDSWIPSTEAAINGQGAILEPLLRSMTTGPGAKPFETAVLGLVNELVDDANGAALMWLRRAAPRLATAQGQSLSERTRRDLDVLASIHGKAPHVARAVAMEEEIEDASKLKIAQEHIDAELAGGLPAYVVPMFGSKELVLRHGATRDSNGQLVIPPPTEPAADTRAADAEADQIARYREVAFALPQGTGGDF